MGKKQRGHGAVQTPEAWHALSSEVIVARLASDVERGLSAPAVLASRQRHGENALPEAAERTVFGLFFRQFASPLIYLLLGAAAVAYSLGHRNDALVIGVVVLLNALIGAAQEGRAERSLSALRKLSTQQARVVRDGAEQRIAARALVVGDVLVLEAGDAIAADARILSAAALAASEAALTGESLPVPKSPGTLDAATPVPDRANTLHAGTTLTAGRARAIVTSVGLSTEIGRIATLAERADEPPTPLEGRVARFGRSVMLVAIVLFCVVMLVGYAQGLPLAQIGMIAISQVVGMIPEGLPVAMTVALSVGVQRMVRRNTVVRRLSAIETLGAISVICSDKTGTLTRNEMTVTAVQLGFGKRLPVSGTGYGPEGTIGDGDTSKDPGVAADLLQLLEACVLCNDAQLLGPFEDAPRYRPLGDPTEVALLTLAQKHGMLPSALRATWPREAEVPFDSANKWMATAHGHAGERRVLLKGAPEILLARCTRVSQGGVDQAFTEEMRQRLLGEAQCMAEQALRVLAFGVVRNAKLDPQVDAAHVAGEVVFLGFVGQVDPPRDDVAEAVTRCKAAGIRPVMVTGDHRATGLAIARALGIADATTRAVDGVELEAMSDAELAQNLDHIAVFARVQPAQKLRIVEAYQRRGDVVAMTGDGVNDAPALARADVGVAMGITGTDVAKQAAKVVITDDCFASIVAAVEEGRVVYANIKKSVLLLMSTSFAEVVILMLALLLGFPPPFAAVQILWNNLVTEGLITVNLVMEPAEGDEMQRPPVPAGESLLPRGMRARLVLMTSTIALVTLGFLLLRHHQGVPAAQVQTETFTLLTVCEWFNVLNCRSERKSALTLDVFRNPWLFGGLLIGNVLQVAVLYFRPLGDVFQTVPLGLRSVLWLGLAASLVLWVEELRKLYVRRHAPSAHSV
jgi:magnesium-transporting ATPase (P-type)